MAGYSIDLRKRVLLDSAEGLDSEEIAEKYRVSRSWVDRVKQRYRENGEIAARKVGGGQEPILKPHYARLEALLKEQPDLTLKELRLALKVDVSLSTIWEAVRALGYTLKKSPSSFRTGPSRRC